MIPINFDPQAMKVLKMCSQLHLVDANKYIVSIRLLISKHIRHLTLYATNQLSQIPLKNINSDSKTKSIDNTE
jgi:hypothetical protein